uniref:RING-type domain-containing protein n=1 Tax=Macrostomum lignano TaxID=282301 RepID=A0A1I8JNQ3_9PLAT
RRFSGLFRPPGAYPRSGRYSAKASRSLGPVEEAPRAAPREALTQLRRSRAVRQPRLPPTRTASAQPLTRRRIGGGGGGGNEIRLAGRSPPTRPEAKRLARGGCSSSSRRNGEAGRSKNAARADEGSLWINAPKNRRRGAPPAAAVGCFAFTVTVALGRERRLRAAIPPRLDNLARRRSNRPATAQPQQAAAPSRGCRSESSSPSASPNHPPSPARRHNQIGNGPSVLLEDYWNGTAGSVGLKSGKASVWAHAQARLNPAFNRASPGLECRSDLRQSLTQNWLHIFGGQPLFTGGASRLHRIRMSPTPGQPFPYRFGVWLRRLVWPDGRIRVVVGGSNSRSLLFNLAQQLSQWRRPTSAAAEEVRRRNQRERQQLGEDVQQERHVRGANGGGGAASPESWLRSAPAAATARQHPRTQRATEMIREAQKETKEGVHPAVHQSQGRAAVSASAAAAATDRMRGVRSAWDSVDSDVDRLEPTSATSAGVGFVLSLRRFSYIATGADGGAEQCAPNSARLGRSRRRQGFLRRHGQRTQSVRHPWSTPTGCRSKEVIDAEGEVEDGKADSESTCRRVETAEASAAAATAARGCCPEAEANGGGLVELNTLLWEPELSERLANYGWPHSELVESFAIDLGRQRLPLGHSLLRSGGLRNRTLSGRRRKPAPTPLTQRKTRKSGATARKGGWTWSASDMQLAIYQSLKDFALSLRTTGKRPLTTKWKRRAQLPSRPERSPSPRPSDAKDDDTKGRRRTTRSAARTLKAGLTSGKFDSPKSLLRTCSLPDLVDGGRDAGASAEAAPADEAFASSDVVAKPLLPGELSQPTMPTTTPTTTTSTGTRRRRAEKACRWTIGRRMKTSTRRRSGLRAELESRRWSGPSARGLRIGIRAGAGPRASREVETERRVKSVLSDQHSQLYDKIMTYYCYDNPN